MAEWNHDIAKAPRGNYRLVAGPKGKGDRKVFEPERIIVASRCGVVTVSYWLPEQKRWSMFTAEAGPIAWMQWDGPKIVIGEDGKERRVLDLPPHPTKATSWFQDRLAERRVA